MDQAPEYQLSTGSRILIAICKLTEISLPELLGNSNVTSYCRYPEQWLNKNLPLGNYMLTYEDRHVLCFRKKEYPHNKATPLSY